MPSEKRALDSDPERSQRRPAPRKRERYTRIACVTCKTRKVKCSGQLPCSRCLELMAECKYQECVPQGDMASAQPRAKPAPTAKDLGQLLRTMKELCDDIESSAFQSGRSGGPAFSLRRSLCNGVRGAPDVDQATSPGFVRLLDQVRANLQQSGYLESASNRTPRPKTRSDPVDANATATLHAARTVLQLGRDKAYAYLNKYLDHVHSAYPCIDSGIATERLDLLFKASENRAQSQELKFDLIDIEIMKVVIAIAMVIEGDNDHPLCRDLSSHIVWNVQSNTSNEQAQIEDIIMATLLTLHAILQNEGLKAWRMIGIAARACLELGLHKYKPNDGKGTGFGKVLFACVYDLDKRCSFFADLPWTLQDKDIDAGILSPDDNYPFLSAMLGLDGMHTEIIKFSALVPPGGNREVDEQSEMFDYRVQKLVDNITLQGLFPPFANIIPPPAVRHVMESFIRARAYQIRMLAYMPYVTTPDTSCHKYLPRQQLISLILSCVDLCLRISECASRLWQPIIDRLLLNAVSCMLLTVSQDSAKYGQICHSAFHAAIEYLGQSFHKVPPANQWSIEDLRKLGEKILKPPLGEEDLPLTDQIPAGNSSMSSTDNSLHLSAQDLAQVCESTDHDALLSLLGSTFAWGSTFEECELV
ncbi:Zn(II)2Cys6 transcription factor [Aspergillus thermomutatus]|uniref:Zn(2)-C6 fungal-type domain-containing protein n=1 Tax=Aspergillus thermomutatus TaxID=41047 RepID=A0A397I1R7_ASPTH|nr:uncharacterized protein CDV56_109418 [Aspergillus thermomutatus]RHZ66780.1 hypothetical protein CDV56_109418 [Aspergillus thermomutatus]